MITKRQRQILRLFEAAAVPPTFQELCTELDLKSTATIREHLEALEKKGLLERRRKKGVSRNWRLTEKAQGYLTKLDNALMQRANDGQTD